MSVHELDAQADRELRLEAQREARAAARAGGAPTPTPAPTPSTMRPTAVASRTTPAALAAPFEVVAELPKVRTGKAGTVKPVPAPRQQLIDYAIEHPGNWLRYLIGSDEPIKKVSTLGNYVKKRQGGFVAGFTYAVRSGQLFIRYDRPTS